MTLLSTSHSASQVVSRRLNCKCWVNNYSGYRMKTFPAVLVFTVVLAAVSRGAAGAFINSKTYVSNWSTRQIRASIVIAPEYPAFVNRLLEPFTYAAKEYGSYSLSFNIEIWIEGSPSHGSVIVRPDRSIVAFDDGPNIDIYLVKYGKLTVIDDSTPEKLTSIYPW